MSVVNSGFVDALYSLKNQVAVVTGGGSGIGRSFAITVAKAGAKVIVVGRRKDTLKETVSEIHNIGGEANYVCGDLTEFDKLPFLVGLCQSIFGTPTILLNVAGVNLREGVEEVSVDSWDQTLAINLKLPFFLARALISGMKERRRGKIINVASLQSVRAFADSLPYGASKGGVVQLTRAMAQAWSGDGITCNAIAPGFFPTDLTRAVYDDPKRLDTMAQQTAVGRNGNLDDLDGALLFFASRASDYVTGQTLYVDGGFTAK